MIERRREVQTNNEFHQWIKKQQQQHIKTCFVHNMARGGKERKREKLNTKAIEATARSKNINIYYS